MARPLNLKALDHIDRLAEFYVKSERNAELLEMVTSIFCISDVVGADEVFVKRVKELKREAKRRKEPSE